MVSGSTPTAEVISVFVPAETFMHGDNVYVKGVSYSIRRDNQKLFDYAQTWELMGAITATPSLLEVIKEEH